MRHTYSMPRMRRVALIYDAKLPYDLKVVGGVARYARQTEFNIYIEENALKHQRLPELRSWHGDGIIADFDDPGIAAAVARSRLPVVGFGGGYGWYSRRSAIPYFFNNQQAVAHMAADHLLERGFRQFAYCGFPPSPTNGWSADRERAFAARVRRQGFGCHVYHGIHTSTRHWSSLLNSLGAWLGSLPKPVGIMAANDKRAHHVLEACRAYDLKVPEELAVVGVDNDELLCELSSPPLSSVEQDAKRLGYEAAALLDRLMQGEKPRQRHFVFDPVGVVTRRSTDILAIDDPLVARSVRHIQSHLASGLKVHDVVIAAAVSRSGLEARFKAAMGCTIHTVIRKAQLERARQMITNTSLAIKEIAAHTGFRSVQQMTTLFRQAFQKPPARYRDEIVR